MCSSARTPTTWRPRGSNGTPRGAWVDWDRLADSDLEPLAKAVASTSPTAPPCWERAGASRRRSAGGGRHRHRRLGRPRPPAPIADAAVPPRAYRRAAVVILDDDHDGDPAGRRRLPGNDDDIAGDLDDLGDEDGGLDDDRFAGLRAAGLPVPPGGPAGVAAAGGVAAPRRRRRGGWPAPWPCCVTRSGRPRRPATTERTGRSSTAGATCAATATPPPPTRWSSSHSSPRSSSRACRCRRSGAAWRRSPTASGSRAGPHRPTAPSSPEPNATRPGGPATPPAKQPRYASRYA